MCILFESGILPKHPIGFPFSSSIFQSQISFTDQKILELIQFFFALFPLAVVNLNNHSIFLC